MEKKIQDLKVIKNLSYSEARKLVYPQPSNTSASLRYSQVVKSTISGCTQTDEKLTRVVCPPLTKIQPLTTNESQPDTNPCTTVIAQNLPSRTSKNLKKKGKSKYEVKTLKNGKVKWSPVCKETNLPILAAFGGTDVPQPTVVHVKDDKLKNMSPFLIQKYIQSTAGNVSSVKKLRSGDLLIETATPKHSEQLLAIKNFGDAPIEVSGHKTLNYTRGVIFSMDLTMVSDEEFVSELQSFRVTSARRITLKRDAITGIGGEPKSVKKLKSGDFLIETLSSSQTKSFLNAKTLLDIPISVTPHKSLNSVRGVISEPDLLNTSDSDILEANSNNVDFHTHLRATNKTNVQETMQSTVSYNSVSESMLTDNLLPDVQDAAESEDYIDYDPEESIDEDFIDDHHRRQPSTSRTVANSKFYPALKSKFMKKRRRKKS
ncbi:hypothetical protein HNY73_013652 [Argiope bruennichi]|uniref:Uncharacterized protein n=1 Tax=Argiope bruennichi TaxID=94029 RepID=A0A8T0F0Y2_ARGBR|nr:hypothetical protein HNY73_013652 [Argiope bruennichi]